ncbi:MAG TPA: TPM domain-containing protein [Steroidobacteraceae bacterium]|nr:TPM domain-containing protein [Steroidobacteraceae bacterium]
MYESNKRSRSAAFKLLPFLAAVLMCLPAWGFDVPEFMPNVVDTDGVLSVDEVARLNGTIAKLRAESHIFAAVLVVPTTQPETIEQAAEEAFRKWALGQKGVDNGLLMLVAVNDRKVRIEVGYGLEGSIPDVTASRIIRSVLVPNFKQQHYAAGLDDALIICNDLVLHGESIRLKPESDSSIHVNRWIVFAVWVFLIVLVPIIVRATAISRAAQYAPSLQPSDQERRWWRIACPNGVSIFLTLFLLFNPGIFFVMLMNTKVAFLTPLFIAFAYIFLVATNWGYLAMLKPAWREKFLTSPRKRTRAKGGMPQAFESAWSGGSSGSSSSSHSSSSSGGGSSGGGGASGSW